MFLFIHVIYASYLIYQAHLGDNEYGRHSIQYCHRKRANTSASAVFSGDQGE